MKTPQELLQQALEAGECLLPDAPPGGRGAHPTVFVHGLLGWGAQDALYRAVPYWGLAAGDVLGYLNACGYDCRAASVGIISSAWDRACELYAELTGGTADYGIAHAQRFGHARFGTAYPNPLVPDWGADRPVDLVGHSFGGATARLLAQLLAHGCPEEVQAAEAAGETPSPLFTGGKSSWVHSMTEVAAPHNGTTFIESNGTIMDVSTNLAETLAKGFGITEIKNLYDFQLEQFGIYKDPNETVLETLQRVFSTDFMSHNDNAFLDLTSLNPCGSLRSMPTETFSPPPFTTTSPMPATRPCRTRSPATTSRRPGCGRCSTPARSTWANTMTSTPPAASTSTRAGGRTTAWSTPYPPSTPSTATAPA